MSADPVTMAIGGAVIGGVMDKKNPLRGAALGGLGGYFGAGALGGGAAAGGAGGAAGGTGLLPGAAGMGLQAPMAGMAEGMGAQGLMANGSNVAGAEMAQMAGGASQIPPNMASDAIRMPSALSISPQKMMEMGGKMAMQGKQQQRPQGVLAAPAPMPMQGAQENFADISPYAGILGRRRVPVM